MKLTKKEEERYEELYVKARDYYLDKTDWNIADCLEDEELDEYAKLYEKINGVSFYS